MNRFFSFILSVVLLHCPVVFGQISLYDFDGFSTGTAVQAPRHYVSLQGRFAGHHLVLTAAIEKDWHLYSVTQPEGGTIRSTFQLNVPELEITEIRPTVEPYVNSNIPGFSVDIEEHNDTVTWIFTFKQDLTRLLEEGLVPPVIPGKLDGQVCQSGEGGTCIPFALPFEAVYDEKLEVAPLLEAAKNVQERFIWQQKNEWDAASVVSPIQYERVETTEFHIALLFAFLGGIILNFMPCVLPVIGLKILSFFEQAGKSRLRAFTLNGWYSLGILSVFLVLAFLSCGLSILFTFDLFNITMACVVFMMALSLFGVWELSVPGFLGRGTAVKLLHQEGFFGAYFKGILTTLLAIPCGAPLLSPAVNWADMQIRDGQTAVVFLAYSLIALGMSSPYLIIGAFPEMLRFLPKPGEWMETFKKIMGFCLLPAVVWILYFVRTECILPTITLLFALWFLCWTMGNERKSAVFVFFAVLVLAVVLCFSFNITANPYTLENAMKTKIYGSSGKHWKPYTAEKFDSALTAGKPVVIDFTADWCVNCKVLEEFVLHSEAVLAKLDEKNAVSLVGDCTREGEAKVFLRKFGADQVPVLMVFDPKKPSQPFILRGGYTQGTLLKLLE